MLVLVPFVFPKEAEIVRGPWRPDDVRFGLLKPTGNTFLFVGRSLYLGFVWVGWLASKKNQVSAYHKKRGVKIDKGDKKDKIIK